MTNPDPKDVESLARALCIANGGEPDQAIEVVAPPEVISSNTVSLVYATRRVLAWTQFEHPAIQLLTFQQWAIDNGKTEGSDNEY